ncbi:minor capsid protein [Billgrantia antri]|uniref:Minor capsid protein n=1 Tax=Halomonas sulfidivorans TaxID=2733488 RepID=A0ABX7WHD4_9GAMM|nr:minor capsid protein [Halomonas sulfidivorans]QTP59540.1 minor capsid protein [Halomonas sulfidivorans]
MTTKEKLDKQIRHSIYLRGQFTRISNELNVIIDELVAKIYRELEKTKNLASPRGINAVIKRVDVLIEGVFKEYESQLTEQMQELGEYESEYSAKSNEERGLGGSALAAGVVAALVSEQAIYGKLASEWVSEQADTMRKSFRQELRIGAGAGESKRQIQERLDTAVKERAKQQSGNAIRTIGEGVTTGVKLETAKKSKAKYYQLSVVLDSRTSKICSAIDTSKVYSLSDPTAPRPPFHPNCRTQIIELESDEPVEQQSYSSFLERQTEQEKRKLLGPGRYALYKKGMKITQFVDENNHVLTLAELRELEN